MDIEKLGTSTFLVQHKDSGKFGQFTVEVSLALPLTSRFLVPQLAFLHFLPTLITSDYSRLSIGLGTQRCMAIISFSFGS